MPPFGIKHAYCTYRIRLHGRLYGSSIAGQWIMESEDGSRTTFQHAWQRIGGRRDVDYPAHLEFFALLLNNESESLGEVSPLAASGSLKHLIPGGTRFWNGHEVPVVEFINPETNQKTRLILVVKR